MPRRPPATRSATVSFAGGHHVGNDGAASEDERERAGPEALGQPLGVFRPIVGACARLRDTGDVDDERVDRGPSLDREDPRTAAGCVAIAPRP